MMKTIPVGSLCKKFVISHTCPKVLRNKDGSVRFTKEQTPMFEYEGMSGRLDLSAYPTNVKIAFFRKFMVGKRCLTPACLKVLFHLCSTLRYSQVEIAYDSKGEPIIAKPHSNEVLAAMTRFGNQTTTQAFSEISKAIGVSEPEVRKAIKILCERNIAKQINIEFWSVQKRLGKDVHPREIVRLEINPDLAWCGPLEHGLAYAETGAFHEPVHVKNMIPKLKRASESRKATPPRGQYDSGA